MTPPNKWLELNQNGFMYLSSQSAPRYPKIWWLIIFCPWKSWRNNPICKAKYNGFSPSGPEAAPPTHGHVSAAVSPPMDADSLCLVSPCWSESIWILCADGLQVWLCPLYHWSYRGCPETSGIEQVALNGLIRPSFRNQGSGMIKRFQGIFEYHISHLAL